jgi:hypothetical protein
LPQNAGLLAHSSALDNLELENLITPEDLSRSSGDEFFEGKIARRERVW